VLDGSSVGGGSKMSMTSAPGCRQARHVVRAAVVICNWFAVAANRKTLRGGRGVDAMIAPSSRTTTLPSRSVSTAPAPGGRSNTTRPYPSWSPVRITICATAGERGGSACSGFAPKRAKVNASDRRVRGCNIATISLSWQATCRCRFGPLRRLATAAREAATGRNQAASPPMPLSGRPRACVHRTP